jgi:3-oxoacyl-[acyl-carrier protein] reductase
MGNYVIIGGTKGIGLQLTKQLVASQNQVYVFSRNKNGLEDHASLHYTALDSETENIDLSSLPEKIDGLVYCPGSILLKPFARFTEQDFMHDWQLNVMGAVRIIQQLSPQLKKSDAPSIVLFSTVAVTIGMPYHSSIAMAKGAIEGLTRSLAAEFAPKIRVNCIAPSMTDTPLAESFLSSEEKRLAIAKRHPLQRVGQPDELAALASFLLSEKAGWITGQIFHADGGMSSLKI